jgi:uncharacterized repeat protein (TIGR01451 family)
MKNLTLKFLIFACVLLGANGAVRAAAPNLKVAATVSDVNGGSLLANEVLEYAFTVTNTGDGDAILAAYTNAMPANTSYVAGSMSIGGVAKTDGILDDQAEYVNIVGLGNSCTFRLGAGATSAAGGTISPGASVTFKFRARIGFAVSAGTAITNQGSLNYNTLVYLNSDADPNAPGEQASIVYVNLTAPSIAITQSVLPGGAQSPGTDLTITSTFTNSGGSSAQNFSLTEPVPSSTNFKLSSAAANIGSTSLTANILYSNDGGTTFAYTPVSGGGGAVSGYDRNVTHVRFAFTGTLSKTAPNNAGSVSFISVIR